MKAVIPVAGVGTRLRPHTHTQPKPLIPVAGVPILGHIIDNLMAAGIRDFVFIIGHLGEKIEAFVEERYAEKINFEFVVQSPRIGLGHALWSAKEEIRKADEVLIVLGDTIFDVDLVSFINSRESIVGVQEVVDPRNFGVAILDEEGYLLKAVEKPKIPKSNLALVGVYKIREIGVFLKSLDQLLAGEPSDTGEYHLTEAFRTMISLGVKIRSTRVDNWFDCGKKETLLEANRILLERIENSPEYKFVNTVILPPVQISPGTTIENSIIGPFVSIDENTIIRNSIVKNSILGAYSSLDAIVLQNSVIGSDASLRGHSHSVNIGDNTEIDFND
ncbi:MAG: NTP transferase domain-containing protein [Bacteroidia bacterium]|nr:NTP transferase domain-containing protein [Bacteroidia bacterium]